MTKWLTVKFEVTRNISTDGCRVLKDGLLLKEIMNGREAQKCQDKC